MQKRFFVVLFFLGITYTQAQIIVRTDFNRERVWHKDYRVNEKWSDAAATKSDSGITTKLTWAKSGTIDVANTVTPSEALVLSVKDSLGRGNWSAAISSGLRPCVNRETHLGKLTLSFDSWVSSIRPVLVKIESFDASRKRTGGLQARVYPPTPNYFLRSSIELSGMLPAGAGKFNPLDSFVNLSFEISEQDGKPGVPVMEELRIDNVNFSSAAYYVSSDGSDNNNGRSETTAFATPQKALNIAKPGDIILLMNGTYGGPANQKAVANFVHAGFPSAWITLKNYPGHKPVILAYGQHGVNIALGNDSTFREAPMLSYIELRGLHIRGNADNAEKLYPADLGTATKNTQVNGINIDGSWGPTRMYHHFRLADNLVEYCGGYGVFTQTVDYLLVENNIFRNNCYTTVELCSAGFACMMYADFDKVDNATKIVVRNNQAYGNQVRVHKKVGTPKIFNGDGFLFDANSEAYIHPDKYLGRTLIQNNLVYGNGGGGIQMWGSHRLDVINNTLYHNGITEDLKWGNLGFDYCKDVRLINNISVALPTRPNDRWLLNRPDKDTAGIVRINNLYYGGFLPNIKGSNDIVADPLFVNPSTDPAVADFRLKPGSPAINSGYTGFEGQPLTDLSGSFRNLKSTAVERGTYSFNPSRKK
ncbi:right-handed parallel beta-helix repeat-containing protein [Flavitalea antarctica]